jgi:hypothetical protein
MPKPRKPASLKPLKTLRIFCEGEKTEPGYLRGYLGGLSSSLRKSVIEIERTRKNTPVQLVEEAIKAKNSPETLPEDEFWVVYDRESVAKYSEELHAKAMSRADRHKVKVSISNVCFEYWLLLHFVNTDAPYSSYSDLIDKSQLNSEIKRQSGKDYGKAAENTFDIVKGGLEAARRRAAKLNKVGIENANPARSKPYHINPYVGVVSLLDAIDAFD